MTVLRRAVFVSSVLLTTLGLAACGSAQKGEPAQGLADQAVAATAAAAAGGGEAPTPAADEAQGRVVEIAPSSPLPDASTPEVVPSLQLSTLLAPPSTAAEIAAPPTVTVTEAPSSGPPTDANGNELVAPPAAPMGTAGEGQVVPINDIDGTFTAECAGGEVQISGIDNTVTITGHCSKLTVSGVDNVVVVDSFADLDLSGVRNHITYLQGDHTEEPGGIECVVVKG